MPGDLINKMSLMRQVRAEVSECCLKWILLGKRRASHQFNLQESRDFGIEEKKKFPALFRKKKTNKPKHKLIKWFYRIVFIHM